MAFSKSLLFLLLVSLLHYYTLKTNKLPQRTMTVTNSNPPLFSENPAKQASEAEEKVYELQKQILELRQEVEMQRKRSLEVETRAEIADKKVEELSSNLENIDLKWLLSKLGLYPNKTWTYLMTLWHDQHLSQTLQKNWVPSIKDAYATLTIYLEPKVRYLTDKSTEVLHSCKQALTPHLIQGFDVSYYYLEVIRIMTIEKPNLEKVQAALQPYTEDTLEKGKAEPNLATQEDETESEKEKEEDDDADADFDDSILSDESSIGYPEQRPLVNGTQVLTD